MKKFLVNLLLFFLSLIVGFIIIEIGFRLILPARNLQPNKGLARADERGYTILQPNFDGQMTAKETGEQVHIKTNAEGFTGNDYNLEKPAGTIRIALLGDSFLEAMQIDWEKTFAHLLEKKLNENSTTTFEVMNFGIGGQGTTEELSRYHYYVKKYQPDYVTLFFFPNDFENNQYYLNDRKKFIEGGGWESIKQSEANFKQDRTDLKYKILKTFRSVQYLDKLVRQNANLEKIAVEIGLHDVGIMGAPEDGIHPGFLIFQNPLPESHKFVYDFTTELIKFFVEQVEKNGSNFLVIYLPQAEQVDEEMWQGVQKDTPGLANYQWDLDQPNHFIGQLASNTQLIFLDLTPAFRQFYQENENKHLYDFRGRYYDGHFNENGHRFVADLLVKYFIELLELKEGLIAEPMRLPAGRQGTLRGTNAEE